MSNKPVAWIQSKTKELPDGCECMQSVSFFKANDNDIPLYTHPVKEPAKQRYDDCMKDCDEPNPVERLRFFLSLALTGQDWLDVEPFIDAIPHPADESFDRTASHMAGEYVSYPAKTLTEEQVIDITKAFFNIHPETHLTEKFNIPLYELTHFARAILKKASEK